MRICLALIFFALIGCASMIKNSLYNAPALNWVHVEKPLKVGDYAVFESIDGSQVFKHEVVSENNRIWEIKTSWSKVGGEVSFLKDINYHYFVDSIGYVEKAYVVDLTTGQKHQLRIAGPGDVGFVENPTKVSLKKPEVIKTKHGSYKVEKILVYTAVQNIGVGTMKTTMVLFLHPKVKFGVVRNRNTVSTDLALEELLQFINLVHPMNKTIVTVMDFLLNKAPDPTHTNGSDIVRTN